MREKIVETCDYGHHWYNGGSCPLCDYLGRENMERVKDNDV